MIRGGPKIGQGGDPLWAVQICTVQSCKQNEPINARGFSWFNLHSSSFFWYLWTSFCSPFIDSALPNITPSLMFQTLGLLKICYVIVCLGCAVNHGYMYDILSFS